MRQLATCLVKMKLTILFLHLISTDTGMVNCSVEMAHACTMAWKQGYIADHVL